MADRGAIDRIDVAVPHDILGLQVAPRACIFWTAANSRTTMSFCSRHFLALKVAGSAPGVLFLTRVGTSQ
eukprot:6381140-Heterocapsa_arctica.AAC.1